MCGSVKSLEKTSIYYLNDMIEKGSNPSVCMTWLFSKTTGQRLSYVIIIFFFSKYCRTSLTRQEINKGTKQLKGSRSSTCGTPWPMCYKHSIWPQSLRTQISKLMPHIRFGSSLFLLGFELTWTNLAHRQSVTKHYSPAPQDELIPRRSPFPSWGELSGSSSELASIARH